MNTLLFRIYRYIKGSLRLLNAVLSTHKIWFSSSVGEAYLSDGVLFTARRVLKRKMRFQKLELLPHKISRSQEFGFFCIRWENICFADTTDFVHSETEENVCDSWGTDLPESDRFFGNLNFDMVWSLCSDEIKGWKRKINIPHQVYWEKLKSLQNGLKNILAVLYTPDLMVYGPG